METKEMISIPLERLAEAAHEVNRVYCELLGDTSQPDWAHAPDWQKQSAVNGVLFHRNNPLATPRDSHESWLEEKRRDGWMWGTEKNPELKIHPCCVPYDDLPEEQRRKDDFFCAVVKTLLGG